MILDTIKVVVCPECGCKVQTRNSAEDADPTPPHFDATDNDGLAYIWDQDHDEPCPGSGMYGTVEEIDTPPSQVYYGRIAS